MAFDGNLSEEDRAKLLRLKTDFPFFARNCLFIRTKSGQIEPLVLNRAQTYLHERLEQQMAETGMVRAIVLKGRQLGASTYIEARYYWRLWKGSGLKAYILTHEQPATDNLFKMAQHYHEHLPSFLAPKTKAANAKELAFADNNCSYEVATAGTKAVGRSATIQLFHGSEVGFWPNAETHVDGVFQAIADAPGTERLLESTANGIGNVFQRRYMAAARGESMDQAIFMPRYWGEDYRADPPDGWDPPPAWRKYAQAHKLNWQQLYWAFVKNRDMASAISEPDDKPCWKFKQEFPATAEEAFQTAGNSFIPGEHVARARQARVIGIGPIIIGVDPARGGDATGIIDRCGRNLGERICERWHDTDTMVLVGKIVAVIKKLRPAAVNIDVGGLGAPIYDRLVEMRYGHIVNPVNFGGAPIGIGPTGDELYANRRAEMWDVMRAWFATEDGLPVQVPDDDILHGDLTSPTYGPGLTRYGSNTELTLEPKDKIRERLGFSPDLGDAAALTFAMPMNEVYDDPEPDTRSKGRSKRTGY